MIPAVRDVVAANGDPQEFGGRSRLEFDDARQVTWE